MKDIIIKTVFHDTQRYPTVGDWFRDRTGALIIKVSDLGDARMEALIAVHELIEALLCEYDGVAEEDVTAFDVAFEKARAPGNVDEPGDSKDAPYHRQHVIATWVERLLAFCLGVDWKTYTEKVNAL